MKKLMAILAILNSFAVLYSQDTEPSAWQFKWGFDENQRIFEPDSFKQNSVLTGFQWSGSLKMNNALLNNSNAGGFYEQIQQGSRNEPLQLIIQPTWMDRNYYQIGAFFAPFMQYEPTLPLSSENFGTILRPADPSNPVFGFLYRRGTILTVITNINSNRFTLYTVSKNTNTER